MMESTEPTGPAEPTGLTGSTGPAGLTEPIRATGSTGPTVIETERLVLRPWRAGDRAEAEALFALASDPEIGPRCGWPPHRTVQDSLDTIAHVFTGDENRAITLRGDDRPIGCIELKPMSDGLVAVVREAVRSGTLADGVSLAGDAAPNDGASLAGDAAHNDDASLDDVALADGAAHLVGTARDDGAALVGGCALDEPALDRLTAGTAKELGYWLGRRYWGHGYMTEALRAVLRHAFADLDSPAVWGEHYLTNPASGRVMERCGLRPVCERPDVWYPLTRERHDCLIRMLPAPRR